MSLVSPVIFICLVFSTEAFADKRILKWVDNQGVTHYGDQMPPTAAGKSNQVINKQGVVVKRNNQPSESKAQKLANQEKFEQERKDSVLLASYTTADEIDLARKRNLEMENATISALKSQKANVDNRLNRNIISAQAFIDKKQTVPDYLKEEISIAKTESKKFDKKIARHQQIMEKINQEYDAEKARFIVLKNKKN
ncbi:MAG TPA: DUF4124 domain-containing protein [Methylophilaceae bacterium]|nr:DUF4124 domain-containing protein [Methylophilaceae bacterium]